MYPTRRPPTIRLATAAATAAAALALTVTAPMTASAAPDRHGRGHGHPAERSFTYAIYGDAPYGTTNDDTSQIAATPAFIDAVNRDHRVSGVVHVGDIHSGKQFCTESYDQQVADLWQGFRDPLVYTPGDNEWADCHKAKEGGGTYNAQTGAIDYVQDSSGAPADYAGGNPVDNLALIRSIFFPHAGETLGSGSLHVFSQAQVASNHGHPTDRQYVENVRWQRGGIMFVSLDVPGGSNDDADPWYGAPTASPQQLEEAENRTGADRRWLARSFSAAERTGSRGVVIVTQADMWDLDGGTADHLANYEPVIKILASRTEALAEPVLLLNGDSHLYRSDNPLQEGAPCTGDADDSGTSVCAYDDWQSHPSYDVSNFHRIVVHGSTDPLEYLRLRMSRDSGGAASDTSFGPFSWERVIEAP